MLPTDGAKNVNISYIFDLKSHVIAKRRNVSEEIAGRNKYVFWAYVKCRLLIQSNEKFYFLENVCYQYFKFCTSSTVLFSYELLIGPQATFLECIVIFLQSEWSTLPLWHGYISRTVKQD